MKLLLLWLQLLLVATDLLVLVALLGVGVAVPRGAPAVVAGALSTAAGPCTLAWRRPSLRAGLRLPLVQGIAGNLCKVGLQRGPAGLRTVGGVQSHCQVSCKQPGSGVVDLRQEYTSEDLSQVQCPELRLEVFQCCQTGLPLVPDQDVAVAASLRQAAPRAEGHRIPFPPSTRVRPR